MTRVYAIRTGCYSDTSRGGNLRAEAHVIVNDVHAPTLEHAIKVASEKRTQLLATSYAG